MYLPNPPCFLHSREAPNQKSTPLKSTNLRVCTTLCIIPGNVYSILEKWALQVPEYKWQAAELISQLSKYHKKKTVNKSNIYEVTQPYQKNHQNSRQKNVSRLTCQNLSKKKRTKTRSSSNQRKSTDSISTICTGSVKEDSEKCGVLSSRKPKNFMRWNKCSKQKSLVKKVSILWWMNENCCVGWSIRSLSIWIMLSKIEKLCTWWWTCWQEATWDITWAVEEGLPKRRQSSSLHPLWTAFNSCIWTISFTGT